MAVGLTTVIDNTINIRTLNFKKSIDPMKFNLLRFIINVLLFYFQKMAYPGRREAGVRPITHVNFCCRPGYSV